MDIDVSLVRQLISAQFPEWAHLPIKPVEFSGWDNRTFRLGEDMTVRLPSTEAYAAQVEKEQRWLPVLAAHLPLAIPHPLAKGRPDDKYPWNWSVYRWIVGENATMERVSNVNLFAEHLCQFLHALQQIDVTGGPPPGLHNFYRGDSLMIYDAETRKAADVLGAEIDAHAAIAVWEAALAATWVGSPVWVHGDIHATNLLVRDGQLTAVIDFGGLSVGDPACDLTMAWTFFSGESRETFKSCLQVDDATWSRARGWALWKGLITLADPIQTHPWRIKEARRVINDVCVEPLLG